MRSIAFALYHLKEILQKSVPFNCTPFCVQAFKGRRPQTKAEPEFEFTVNSEKRSLCARTRSVPTVFTRDLAYRLHWLTPIF